MSGIFLLVRLGDRFRAGPQSTTEVVFAGVCASSSSLPPAPSMLSSHGESHYVALTYSPDSLSSSGLGLQPFGDEYLHKSFGIRLHRTFVSSHLFTYPSVQSFLYRFLVHALALVCTLLYLVAQFAPSLGHLRVVS